MFVIKFNEKQRVSQINQYLAAYGIEDNPVLTDKDNLDWVDEINAPDSKQKHLKPENGVMTLELLKSVFPTWCETYRYETDLYFGRTEEKVMKGLASFVKKHKDLIKYVKGSDMLIERGEIAKTYHAVLKSLELPEKNPIKLPKNQQTTDNIQSGVLLCKSWCDTPFWVVFGNVETPTFMKKRIYEEDIYNDLYKTKEGYAVMLLPLLQIGKVGHIEEITTDAWNMSLREHPAYFATLVYDAKYMHVDDVVKSISEYYTTEELNARLEDVRQRIIGMSYHHEDGRIVEQNGRKHVYGTQYNHLYQSSKEKRAWDLIVGALIQKTETVKS